VKRSRKPPTKAESARLGRVKQLPCIACLKRGVPQGLPTECHHTLSGGKRRGHSFVVSLCQWHHRGRLLDRWSKADMTRVFGPSLANGSKPFHAAFGDDDYLLAETNSMLGIKAVA
jgi:hypothetical protein